MNSFENAEEFDGLILGEEEGVLNKIEFNGAEGLFRLIVVKDGDEQATPWMAGSYLKGKLPDRVAASEYGAAVAFIDERDPQNTH